MERTLRDIRVTAAKAMGWSEVVAYTERDDYDKPFSVYGDEVLGPDCEDFEPDVNLSQAYKLASRFGRPTIIGPSMGNGGYVELAEHSQCGWKISASNISGNVALHLTLLAIRAWEEGKR